MKDKNASFCYTTAYTGEINKQKQAVLKVGQKNYPISQEDK